LVKSRHFLLVTMSMQRMLIQEGDAASESADVIDDDVKANLVCPSALSAVLSILCPCAWLCSIRTIQQNEQAAVMAWGQYAGSIMKPGLTIINPCGIELRKASTARTSLDLKDVRCSDAKGNPIIVSGNVIYKIYSVKKAKVDIQNIEQYISEQGPMVLRKVCSLFPFDSSSGPSLRGGGTAGNYVGAVLRKEFQTVLHDSGIEVLKFDLSDIYYAAEIAAAMLQKQQAEAMVEARELIVQSAVDIASSPILRMKAKGHQLSAQGEERILGNLLTVICSDKGVQTTMPLQM